MCLLPREYPVLRGGYAGCFVETASGNVRNSVDITVSDDVEDLLHINSGRGQCYFTERFVTEFRIYLVKVKCSIRENLADKAEAV